MLRKPLLALLAFQSVTFAASVNYSASVSCNADGSAPTIMSGSTLSQGLFMDCAGTTSYGLSTVELASFGPTVEVTPLASAGVVGTDLNFVVTVASISDPNMSIINTGLPNGTPLNVEETWTTNAQYSYSPSGLVGTSSDGTVSVGGYLQVGVNGMTPSTDYIQTPGCIYGASYCNQPAQAYGNGSDTLNVPVSFQTSVGSDFLENIKLEGIAGASGHRQAFINFYNFALVSSSVQLSSFTVTNANTGQSISSAILQGSSGPYLLTASDVPEIDANSAASAIALIVGVLLIYRGRRSFGSLART